MVKNPPDLALKQVLRENVMLLMERPEFGGFNTTKLGKFARIATGGAQRILDDHTDVQIGLVGRVAKAFGLPAWRLLAPELGKQALSAEAAEAAAIVDALPNEDQRRRALAIIVQMIELNNPRPEPRADTPTPQPLEHR